MMRGKKRDLWLRLNERRVFFVAEAGKNFIQTAAEQTSDKYLEQAKELAQRAKEAGADAIKWQTHYYQDEQWPVKVVSPHFNGADRYSWVKRNSEITSEGWWKELKQYCDEIGIIFFSTPMSRGAAQVLSRVGVDLWKIGSGDILDFVLLDYLRCQPQPVIISTGMSNLRELDQAIDFISKKNKRIVITHCVSKYPCPPAELNVRTVRMLRQRYRRPVGFSDHSLGFAGVLQAVKCGATVIEKHFSLDRNLWGSDHKVSMTPAEYAKMVRTVRQGVDGVKTNKKILGQVTDQLVDHQSKFRGLFRKSLVSGANIRAGEVIKPAMVRAMRPQAYIPGIRSEYYEEVVGKKALRDIKAQEPLRWEDIELGAEKKKIENRNIMRINKPREGNDIKKVSVLAIVPARGGSKSIIRKNIVKLNGRPLLAYTLAAINKAQHEFDHLVSTEDETIRAVALKYGGHVPYLRPLELAQDETNIIDVLEDIVRRLVKRYEYLLLLQPTAPLRSAADIDAALDIALRQQATSVCSFTKVESYHPWYMYYLLDDGRVRPVVATEVGLRRQEFPPALWRNGAIYLVQTKYFLAERRLVSDDCVPYIMPQTRSVNIDSVDDLTLAEHYLKREKLKTNKLNRFRKVMAHTRKPAKSP